MKKTIALIISFIMLLSVFGITAGAAVQKGTYGDFKYIVTDKNSVTVTKYTGKSNEITFPAKIKGKTVTAIGSKIFYSNEQLKSVIIPEGVKTIKEYAFFRCSNLESVRLPESLTSIAAYAFIGCKKLKSIEFPKNLSKLGTNVFVACESLKEVTIPQKLTVIPDRTFEGCISLQKVNLHDSITAINYGAFMYCTSLEEIKLPKKLSSIEISVFIGCHSLKSISIPDSVTKIDSFAFSNCDSLERIKLPNKLKSIGIAAFGSCTSLKNIYLPKSLSAIGSYAFEGCTKLEKISGGKGVTEIGSTILRKTPFSRNKANWKNGALYYRTWLVDLKKNVKGNFKVKEGTTVISYDAFNSCKKLTGVYLPKSVVGVNTTVVAYTASCFDSPSLKKITVSQDNKYFKSVDGILYSKDMKTLYRYPAAKSEKSFSISKSVKVIINGAFSGCNNLVKISFHPDSAAVIGDYSFDECENLCDITVTKRVTVEQYAGLGWNSKKSKEEIIKTLKIKGNSSNKSLMKYLELYGLNDCFVPLCKDGSENHTLKTAKAKAPTYFSKGYAAFKYCTVCKEKIGVKHIARKQLPSSTVTVKSSDGKLKIKYNAINGADGFQLLIVSKNGGKKITKTFNTENSKNVTIGNLERGEYFVAFRVFKKDGKTAYSNWTWKNTDKSKTVFTVK